MTPVASETATLESPPAPAQVASAAPAQPAPAADDLVLAELLVEEISIDGMCGVY